MKAKHIIIFLSIVINAGCSTDPKMVDISFKCGDESLKQTLKLDYPSVDASNLKEEKYISGFKKNSSNGEVKPIVNKVKSGLITKLVPLLTPKNSYKVEFYYRDKPVFKRLMDDHLSYRIIDSQFEFYGEKVFTLIEHQTVCKNIKMYYKRDTRFSNICLKINQNE